MTPLSYVTTDLRDGESLRAYSVRVRPARLSRFARALRAIGRAHHAGILGRYL